MLIFLMTSLGCAIRGICCVRDLCSCLCGCMTRCKNCCCPDDDEDKLELGHNQYTIYQNII